MSLLDIAKKRYSVRKYEDKPVEKEKLEKILACAHVAPTAANLQPVKLLVVQDTCRRARSKSFGWLRAASSTPI